jgi:2-polyprenyl-3-methyl-5-hydroxy-6-metoxy-1,4-benzoquinol methylase
VKLDDADRPAGNRRHSALRDRLYAAYATTHAGITDSASVARVFRRDILPHLPGDQQADILDLGCGQGLLVKQLTDLGYMRARGIDISPEQVETAHQAGVTQVALGDFRKYLTPGSVNAVIATDFFEHLTKFENLEAMDCIHAALRPGGSLILRVPNAVSPFGGNYRHGDLTHETSFTPRSLRQLASAAGFAKVEVFPSLPPVHGLKSAVRAGLWRAASVLMKAALIAETGQLRGHIVTQNVIAVLQNMSTGTAA